MKDNKQIKKLGVVEKLAQKVGLDTVKAGCFWLLGQPPVPEKLKQIAKIDKKDN